MSDRNVTPSTTGSSRDRLNEIRTRLDAASPGEWPFGELMRHLLPPDADLIAHAPADIAWLLAEVERLRDSDAKRERRIASLGAAEIMDKYADYQKLMSDDD